MNMAAIGILMNIGRADAEPADVQQAAYADG
jgi:hypothetical protein